MPDENQALSPDYLFRLKSFLVDIAIEGRGKLKNLYGQQRVARTQAELNKLLDSHERFAAARGGARAKLGMADLSGLDLANRLLKEIDFAGSSLMDASLFGSDLRNASFYCTDLQRADLRNTNLQFADLRGASLKGANLSCAKLDNADLRAAMMMFMSPEGISIIDRSANGPQGVDFSNCSLKKASFGNAKLDGANCDGAFLQGADFKGAKLSAASFKGAVLTGVNVKDLNVSPEDLQTCVTDVTPQTIARFDELRSRLDSHQQWIVSGGTQGTHCVLDGEDIRLLQKLVVGRPLTGLSAKNAIAISLNFSGCQLQGARLDGADLRDADFTGADLRGASFRGANISHARFGEADMRGLPLINGQVRNVDFTDAIGLEEQFSTCQLDGAASLLGLRRPMAAAA